MQAPVGTLTLLFTDIEGSTELLERSASAYATALDRHNVILRDAVERHAGLVYQTTGDGLLAVFGRAADAIAAALDAQRNLQTEPWAEGASVRARMAIHSGDVELRGGEYFGAPLHRAARLLAIAHGEQVVVSGTTASLVGSTLPDGASLLDRGPVYLRDFREPERVFQLVHPDLRVQFPPLRAADLKPQNLPRPVTPFIGRDQELEEVRARLGRPEVRLLTLTGPAGTGKTRLAIEAAAHSMDDFADGVFFVPLATVQDPRLVVSTIARTLGVHEASGQPIFASLTKVLAKAHRLLVLDNFEQLIDAAEDVAALVSSSPSVKVVVTSRSPLHISGEYEMPVPPLAVPDPSKPLEPQQLGAYEAVKLFVERARAVRPNFALDAENARAVAEICVQVDGLPLAIELAAARIRLLPPREIAARLDHRLSLLTGGAADLPPRQRTLRAAVGWSHDLLDEPERVLFRRLAVFAGGWALDAAEEVCGDGVSVSVFDGLDSLVAKSLVRPVESRVRHARFAMLATIREYSEEQLAASGEEDQLRDAHAAHYLGVAESAERRLEGPEQAEEIRMLEEERDNLRTALDRYVSRADFLHAARLAGALGWFWWIRGHLTEARVWVERVLALPGAEARTLERAKALYAGGLAAMAQQDRDQARRWLEEAVAIRAELDDQYGLADALHFLGDVMLSARGPVEAAKYYVEAEAVAQRSDHQLALFAVRGHLAINAFLMSDHVRARVMYDELIPIARRVANPWGLAMLQVLGGLVSRAQGDPRGAHSRLQESLSLFRDIGDRFGVLFPLLAMAAVQGELGDPTRAVRVAAAVQAAADQIGAALPPPLIAALAPSLEAARSSLPEEAVAAASAEGRAMEIDAAIAYALEPVQVPLASTT